MSEVYLTDNELLNLVSDVETGVEFIPTGTAPYYLHFRKLLHRLLLATKRANDLRVYDEGGLEIGVKGGKFWVGGTLVSFVGSSGNTLADDKAAIYVCLDSTGSLVTDEYTAFPVMSEQAHVRLAVVETAGGDIVSISDARDHHSVFGPRGDAGTSAVNNVTADRTLLESESGQVFSNRGATGTVALTLPANAAAGTKFSFVVQEFQRLQVDPGAGAIRDDIGATAGKYKWADYVGENLTVVADGSGDWFNMSKWGLWSEEV